MRHLCLFLWFWHNGTPPSFHRDGNRGSGSSMRALTWITCRQSLSSTVSFSLAVSHLSLCHSIFSTSLSNDDISTPPGECQWAKTGGSWFIQCFQTYAERRKSRPNRRNMCYAGIRLLKTFLLHQSPWWADKISLWRNTACRAASKELKQQQAQQKTSAGEWFHRRG